MLPVKKRILVFLVIIVTVVCAFLFTVIYREAGNNAIKKLNDEQVVHAKLAAFGIQDFFGTWSRVLSSYARIEAIVNIDADGKRYMNLLYEAHQEQIRSITRMDERGTIIHTVPFSSSIGNNISNQKHVREILTTHKPVVSDVFRAVQGFDAIVLHVPIFKGPAFKGTIAVLINFESLAKRYLDVIKVGDTGYAWVVSREGIQLYSPTNDFVGKSVYENFKGHPSAIAMVNEMLKGHEGTAEYTFDRIGDRHVGLIKKYAVYLPIQLGNTFWSIAVTSGEQDMLSGLISFRNRLVLMIGIVFIFGIVFSTLGAKAWLIVNEEEKRRSAEKALRESEEIFRYFMEHSPIFVFFKDENIRPLRLSRNYETMLGKPVAELLGRNMDDLFPSELAKSMVADDLRILNEGKVITVDEEFNGRLYTTIKFPIFIEGKARYLAGFTIDVTEHRKLEEQYLQAQKMESIGTLAGGVAHDFNNILSAIIGYGDMTLMKMAEDDPLRLNIENMLEAAYRAAHLTKDLLLFSRKQLGDRKSIDLNDVVRKVEKFLQRVIGEDIDLKTILQDRPITAFADSHQLEQVLMNLATNARDAMSKGGVFTIKVEEITLHEDFTIAHGYGKPGPYAMITVSDTGIGMYEETRKHIFEPFFTTKEVGKGTGLGLSAVYGIIKQHDGFINVYSEPGKGTTFRIYLPLIAAAATEETKARELEAPARGTETVLLAEDDEALRKLSSTVLAEYGYAVIEAVDGEDAVKKFMENTDRIQILLFDLIMPKMNGKDAYDKIRLIKPDVKVIFSSGYAPDIIRQKVALEDNAHLLYKPISPFDLLRKLREVLDR